MKEMIKEIWKSAVPVVLAGVACAACTNEVDDVFSTNATQRIEAAMAECDETLQGAEYGWRFDYTPTNGATVNYVMNFKNGRVRMENTEGETSESTYKIVNAEGPVLSFDTYSILHELADPSKYPYGTGYGGEFEFVVTQVTEDTVYVRGRKSGNDFKLSRAPRGEIQHIRLETSLDVDGGKDIAFFHTFRAGGQDVATLFLGEDKHSLDIIVADGQVQNMPVEFSPEGFRLSAPLSANGVTVSEMQWDNAQGQFVSADGSVVLSEASASPFNLGPTVDQLLASPYYIMKGASAPATLQLVEFAKAFTDWQRMEFFFNADAVVDTLKYRVDTEDNVEELEHAEGRGVLNSMSVVVNNTYGLPEWGNFTVKRVEQKDEDEVTFVEGIRNGAPANTLNRNIYFKKIKGIFFDAQGVSVVYRNGLFYVVSSSSPNMWLILQQQSLPQPAMSIPTLVQQ